jgi:hypothetical protein
MLIPHVVPGVSTAYLDQLAREFILDHGALPACLFYKGYSQDRLHLAQPRRLPRHPGRTGAARRRHRQYRRHRHRRRLARRHSRMYGVGEVSPAPAAWSTITYEGLERGLAAVKPGATTGDIGHAIQSYVESQRCSVVRDFCGHGLGQVFHDAPNILHFGRPGQGEVLQPGMFFTVEPMVNLGKSAGEAAERRLDGRDPRQVPVGPVRALDRRDRRRRRDLHRLARGPVQAADPNGGSGRASSTRALPRARRRHLAVDNPDAMRPSNSPRVARAAWSALTSLVASDAAPDEAPVQDHAANRSASRPTMLGHRERLRERVRLGGFEALPDYELLELYALPHLPARRRQADRQGAADPLRLAGRSAGRDDRGAGHGQGRRRRLAARPEAAA